MIGSSRVYVSWYKCVCKIKNVSRSYIRKDDDDDEDHLFLIEITNVHIYMVKRKRSFPLCQNKRTEKKKICEEEEEEEEEGKLEKDRIIILTQNCHLSLFFWMKEKLNKG